MSASDRTPAHLPRTRRSSAEVRQLLIEASVEAFSTKGYQGATVQDIARSAGLGQSAVYNHFASKEDLFRAAMVQPFLDFLDNFTEIWRALQQEPWETEHLLEEYVRLVYRNMRVHSRLIIELASARDHLSPEISQDVRRASTRMFLEISAIGGHEAHLRALLSTERLELTIRLVTAMMTAFAVLDDWLQPTVPSPISEEDIVDHAAKLARWGVTLGPSDRSPQEST